MHLHYNAACAHTSLPTLELRLLYMKRDYAKALQEADRLNKLRLSASERLVVNTYEVMTRLAGDAAQYPQAIKRMIQLAQHVNQLTKEDFKAAFYAQWLVLAGFGQDHTTVDKLTNNFFNWTTRTPVTEAYWRLAQGVNIHYTRSAGAALRIFQTVLFLPGLADACLKEIAARHLADCLNEEGDTQAVIDVLSEQGLLRNLGTEQDDLALERLLVLPPLF